MFLSFPKIHPFTGILSAYPILIRLCQIVSPKLNCPLNISTNASFCFLKIPFPSVCNFFDEKGYFPSADLSNSEALPSFSLINQHLEIY